MLAVGDVTTLRCISYRYCVTCLECSSSVVQSGYYRVHLGRVVQQCVHAADMSEGKTFHENKTARRQRNHCIMIRLTYGLVCVNYMSICHQLILIKLKHPFYQC